MPYRGAGPAKAPTETWAPRCRGGAGVAVGAGWPPVRPRWPRRSRTAATGEAAATGETAGPNCAAETEPKKSIFNIEISIFDETEYGPISGTRRVRLCASANRFVIPRSRYFYDIDDLDAIWIVVVKPMK